MIEAARLQAVVTADTGPAERELRGYGGRARNTLDRSMGDAGRSSGHSFGKELRRVLAGLGVYAIGRTLVNGVMGTLEQYAANESLKRQLQSMYGMELVDKGQAADFAEGFDMAAGKAEELYNWTRKLAVESPFSATDIAPIMQLSMAMGFTADEAQRMTEGLIDWGAATGRSGPEMEGVARAIAQIGMKGKVSMEELQQMGERGMGALRILADAAGVTTGEMQKLIESGDVDVGWAQEQLLQWFEQFDGAAEKSSGTWQGLLSSLADIKAYAATDFLGPTFEALQPFVQKITDALSDPAFQAGIQQLGQQLGAWAGVKLEGLASTIQQIVDIWTDAPAAGPVKPAFMDGGAWEWDGLPDPGPEKAKADKWGETFAVITGWDATRITEVLDLLFPKRGGAEERRSLLPEFGELPNFDQWAQQMQQGADPLNAALGALFDVNLEEKQQAFNERMRTFWTGLPGRVAGWLNESSAAIGEAMGKLVDNVRQGWEAATGPEGVFGVIGASFSDAWGRITEFVGTNVIEPAVNWNTNLVFGLTRAWQTVTEWVTNNIITPLADWFKPLRTDLEAAWPQVTGWINANIITPVVDWFTPLVQGLKDAWESVTDWVTRNVIDVIINWVWGSGPDAPPPVAGPNGSSGGFIGPAPAPGTGDRSSGSPGFGLRGGYPAPPSGLVPQGQGLPAMGLAAAGSGNVYINNPVMTAPLDIAMLANEVARRLKQGRV